MKNFKLIFSFILTLFVVIPSQAQFLKKLKDKVEQAAERTVIKRTEEKTEEQTEKTFDDVFNPTIGGLGGESEPPREFYKFNYEYKMEVGTDQGSTTLIYLLNDSEDYYGSLMPEENKTIYTVLDQGKNTIHIFMDGGNKSLFSNGLNMKKIAKDKQIETQLKIEKLSGSKQILGYSCDGYKAKGTNQQGLYYESELWVLPNPPVSFSTAMGMMNDTNFPTADAAYLEAMNGLILEMNTNTYKLKNNGEKKNEKYTTMLCTSLKQKNFQINSAEYASAF